MLAKWGKDSWIKENYRPVFLMNTDIKILKKKINKILAHHNNHSKSSNIFMYYIWSMHHKQMEFIPVM